MKLPEKYAAVRKHTEEICKPLKTEDYVVQPIVDVSPPKWHIGHTTWFFEIFVLKPHADSYQEFDSNYNFVFNSYYESVGARVIRTDRGNLSRPSVEDVYKYRKHVDRAMQEFLSTKVTPEVEDLVTLGLNHEQQHQELLLTDIKYILGNNPLFPAYGKLAVSEKDLRHPKGFVNIDAGIYEIGHQGNGFCFDNELAAHQVYLQTAKVSKAQVTNGEYLQFMDNGGYENFAFWHAEGWDWVNTNKIIAPLYWYKIEDQWMYYTYEGLQKVDLDEAVCHVSYYEAAAYAAWKEMRLPTEFEWEVAAKEFEWGNRWEWTESAYLPYPGFARAPGAIGEYNGKFMVNQKVLRGASEVTSPGHSRLTYRNFFHPHLRWQFTGIRLAK